MNTISIESGRRDRTDFLRGRGVAWVCDIANSSKYLNDDKSVSGFEEFLRRFFWLAPRLVESSGGRFIKWNGDGFLAWFETPLHRDLGSRATLALGTAWRLTFMVNVTRLGIPGRPDFRIRHGITYEQDALIMRSASPAGGETFDILGRDVVLAFRLAGIRSSSFPNIVTQRDLVAAALSFGYAGAFCKYAPSSDDKLTYFKGETYGIKGLVKSIERRQRKRSRKSVVKQVDSALSNIEPILPKQGDPTSPDKFTSEMLGGPPWARAVIEEETRFVTERLIGPVKQMLEIVKTAQEPPTTDLGKR